MVLKLTCLRLKNEVITGAKRLKIKIKANSMEKKYRNMSEHATTDSKLNHV